jgi:P27 family predicted phage terminase small subunit
MTIRGRKPTPTHLKLVKGNPGKRPINKKEPKPDRNLPLPPKHLSDEAKVEWGRISEELYKMGLLSNIDRSALAAYCQAYARWSQAERKLTEIAKKDEIFEGLLSQTKNGNWIQNPLIGIANKAMADMVKYATEFGMTPSSRSRVESRSVENKSNFADFG